MIDAERIGRSIKTLREKAGYTQKDLAERLFLSPMAVSKWERGLSVPDVSCLQHLAVVLDTDVDSILEASATYMNRPWKGVIRLKTDTADSIVCDKPVIDYLISYFLLSGIRHVTIAASSASLRYISDRFGTGALLGCYFTYVPTEADDSVEQLLSGSSDVFSGYRIMLMTGPFFLFGADLTRFLQRVIYSTASFARLCTVKGELLDGPKKAQITGTAPGDVLPPPESLAQYLYAELPLLFFDYDTFLIENRGRFPMEYARVPMDKGFVDIDLTGERGIRDASAFVQIVQQYNGYLLNCPFEIARRRGMISREEVTSVIASGRYPEYTEYLRKLLI